MGLIEWGKKRGDVALGKLYNILKKMLYLLNRPQKILCGVVLLLTLVGAVLECLGVSVIIPVMSVLMEPNQFLNSSIAEKFPLLHKLDSAELIAFIMGSVIMVYLLKNGFFIFLSWIRIKFSCKIERELSIHMMKSYMSRGYQFFQQRSYGELNRGVVEDTKSVYYVLYAGFRLASDAFTILIICLFMIATDWRFSFGMIAMAVICVLLIYMVCRKGMRKIGIKYREFNIKAGQDIYEAFGGIKDVLVLRHQMYFVNSYEKNRVQEQIAQSKQVVGMESPAYLIEGLCISGFMIMVGIRAIAGGGVSTGFISTLAAFAVGSFRILPSLGRISSSLNQVLASLPGVDAVYDNIIEAEQYAAMHPELDFMGQDRKHARLIARDAGIVHKKQIIRRHFDDALVLNNISFRYKDDADDIFRNMSLTIKKGQSVAIIGSSGAGKSTLVDILLGLLVPQQGEILVDGMNITKIADEWSEMVGYVPQTVFLSSGSIRENVAFGVDDSEIDDELVMDVLRRAELYDFVQALPDGMDTLVGDRGVRLSGGQRQRIAIARALYHEPEIMVLDEATSALDNETETAIMSAIDALQGHVTLVIVAHRLTTIKNCDVIYEVADQGICVRDKDEVLKGV